MQARRVGSETDFLLQLQLENSFIKGVIGWADLEVENLRSTLSRYEGKVSGFRLSLEEEPNGDHMLGAAFQQGIRMLGDFNFTLTFWFGRAIWTTALDLPINLQTSNLSSIISRNQIIQKPVSRTGPVI